MNEKGRQRIVHRTCRVPLMIPGGKEWMELRRISYLCAHFGNHLLTESYAKTKGLGGLHPYTDYRTMLSSAVRDAVSRECVGIWRRLGKQILKGEETLARFSANRALVIRGQGVILERLQDHKLVLKVRLHPARTALATVFPVWMPAVERDLWLSKVVNNLEAGNYRLTRLALVFERPGRKVVAFVSYSKSMEAPTLSGGEAVLECSSNDCHVRTGDQRLTLNDAIHRLAVMKAHFAGIHTRLRKHLGKPGRRRTLRISLLKAGSFEEWAQGPMHQLSHQIVEWSLKHQVTVLRVIIREPTQLPWARLEALISYKAEEAGIQMIKTAMNESSSSYEWERGAANQSLDAIR